MVVDNRVIINEAVADINERVDASMDQIENRLRNEFMPLIDALDERETNDVEALSSGISAVMSESQAADASIRKAIDASYAELIEKIGYQGSASDASIINYVDAQIGELRNRAIQGDQRLHNDIVAGDKLKITLAPKGFGSENMSRVFMLKPADGIEGVKEAILTAVRDAGPNACPPMVIGVGIGGTFEKSALMAKQALTREFSNRPTIPWVKDLEDEMLEKINKLGIGPGGLGGTTTALAVNINTYATHIAGLPVAINICCHVNRHITREL